MNTQAQYTQFALVREMMETPSIVKNFKLENADNVVETIQKAGKLFFTGEGSSRIFPAKNAMYLAHRMGLKISMAAEGGRQAAEYELSDHVVFGASNSGSTKEIISLFDFLKNTKHNNLYALTANNNTKLESLANQTFVLSCGKEEAVAATKSVAEQALFYYALLLAIQKRSIDNDVAAASEAIHDALTMPIDAKIINSLAKAETICFAGRNDGVAEELTLKTNEITRKKSDYFEGTYAVHGVEEVLRPNDLVVLVNPFKSEIDKIKTTLVDGVKMQVFVIGEEDSIFPTIKIKNAGALTNIVYLAAGWNILVEVGIKLGINLDKPSRARKIGNDFNG